MVFLIQNTQNRDATAIQLKLDELIRGVQGARTGLVALEEMSDADLEELQEQFTHLREDHDVASVEPHHGAVSGEKSPKSRRRRPNGKAP
jgi:low affinity Fe/Cu permease